MKLRTSLVIALSLLFRVDASALSLELAHTSSGGNHQLGLSGDHRLKLGKTEGKIEGQYARITGKTSTYQIAVTLRHLLFLRFYHRTSFLTHQTHDRASTGLEFDVLKNVMMRASFSGNYAREYKSGEFKRFLRGEHVSLAIVGAHLLLTPVKKVTLQTDVSFIQAYGEESGRVDVDNELRYAATKRLFVSSLFERSRRVNTIRTVLGVSF